MRYSRTHVCATSLANARVLCTEAKSSTWIATTRLARKAAMRSARSLLGAPSSHRPGHVMLEQLEQLRTRSFRPLPTATRYDEGQACTGVLEAPFVIVAGITRLRRKKGARVVRVVWAKL